MTCAYNTHLATIPVPCPFALLLVRLWNSEVSHQVLRGIWRWSRGVHSNGVDCEVLNAGGQWSQVDDSRNVQEFAHLSEAEVRLATSEQ